MLECLFSVVLLQNLFTLFADVQIQTNKAAEPKCAGSPLTFQIRKKFNAQAQMADLFLTQQEHFKIGSRWLDDIVSSVCYMGGLLSC